MAEDIVGTAFVRIKALTKNLGKEIRSSVERGMKDAKLDEVGEEYGTKTGDGFSDGFSKKIEKDFTKQVKSSLGNSMDDVAKDVRKRTKKVDLGLPKFDNDTLDDIRDSINDLYDGIDVRVDNFEEEAEKSLRRVRNAFRRTGDDINRGPINRSLDDIASRFANLGKSGSFNVGLLRGSMALLVAGIVAALPYLQDVGSAVLAYATGLVAQVGFLGTAVVGLGTAAIAAIGGAAVAIAPIVLAFASETEALIDFKDAAKAAGEEFLRIGTATQVTLLPALDDALQIITGLVPMFSEFGFFAGRAVGQFARLAAETLVGAEAQERFSAILGSSLRILDMLFPVLVDVGDILSGLWVASIPAAERFVASLGRVLGNWQAIVDEGLRTGSLERTLSLWYERAEVLGRALSNLSGAIWDIFEAGADASDGVFRGFDEWAERYRAWTSSEVGQNKLKLIFSNSLEVMREINGVIADLFDGIFGRLGKVGGVDSMVESLQRFRDFLPTIQEAWANFYDTTKEIVGVLKDNAWGKFRQAMEKLREPLGRLVVQIGEFLDAMAKSGAFDVFLDLMRILTDTLSVLLSIPGFGTFVGYMIAFGSAAKIAGIALGPFVPLVSRLVPLLIGLASRNVAVALGGTATALGRLATAFSGANASVGVAANFQRGVEGIAAAAGGTKATGLATSLGAATKALTGSAAFLPALGLVGGALAVGGIAFFNHQRRMQNWKQEVRQATDALGLLNGGLNTAAEGVAKYITETSRFASKDQIDDLSRLGFTAETFAKQFQTAALGYREFLDAALAAGEISIEAQGDMGVAGEGPGKEVITSLRELQAEYNLTAQQLEKLVEEEYLWLTSDTGPGVSLKIKGNSSILASYEELRKALGQAAKDNIDAFVFNDQNVRLLGSNALLDLKRQIEEADVEDAFFLMAEANNDLAAAAIKSSAGIKGLSEATRDQIREQTTLADGTVDVVRENQLLYDASQKLSKQIREQLDLFNSNDFILYYGDARKAVMDFSLAVGQVDLSTFNDQDGIDQMMSKFPELGGQFDNLFTYLRTLPTDEFNAAARILGYDADQLREAMDGAARAMEDLQRAAVENLPSVGELLDKATSVQEDGTQTFNHKAFADSVNKRIRETEAFGENIKNIMATEGAEAARLAIQQGPAAAAAMAEMVSSSPGQVKKVIQDMEAADRALQAQIRDVMGPAIALEYANMGDLVGRDMTLGIGRGINSPETLEAIKAGGLDTMDAIASGMRGHFEWINGVLQFVHTGVFRSTPRGRTAPVRKTGPGPSLFSAGGFVGDTGMFGSGPVGTDTVAAWLTPGEFVLRRAVAQAIPPGVLNSLNSGDPRIIGLLTSLNQTRPASPQVSTAGAVNASAGNVGGAAGGNLIINGMRIEAPTPLESARQVANRLKILQTQHTRR